MCLLRNHSIPGTFLRHRGEERFLTVYMSSFVLFCSIDGYKVVPTSLDGHKCLREVKLCLHLNSNEVSCVAHPRTGPLMVYETFHSTVFPHCRPYGNPRVYSFDRTHNESRKSFTGGHQENPVDK